MLVESLKWSWKDLALFWTQTLWQRAQGLSAWVGHVISKVCKAPITVLLFEAVNTKKDLPLVPSIFGILKTSIAEELRLQNVEVVLLRFCCEWWHFPATNLCPAGQCPHGHCLFRTDLETWNPPCVPWACLRWCHTLIRVGCAPLQSISFAMDICGDLRWWTGQKVHFSSRRSIT